MASDSNKENGLGTISFYGNSLFINITKFISNINSKGSGIYIDGSTNLYDANVTLENLIFDSNFAHDYGAGIILGNNIFNVQANFSKIICRNQQAYCILLYFLY